MHGFKDLIVSEKEKDNSIQIGIRTTHQSALATSPIALLVFSNYKGGDKKFNYATGQAYPDKYDYFINHKCLSLIPILNIFIDRIIKLPKELALNYINFFSLVAEKKYSTKKIFRGYLQRVYNIFPKVVVGGVVSFCTAQIGGDSRKEFRVGSEITLVTRKFNGYFEFGTKLSNSVDIVRLAKNPFEKFTYFDMFEDIRVGVVASLGPVTIAQNINFAGITSTDCTIQVKQVYESFKSYASNNTSVTTAKAK